MASCADFLIRSARSSRDFIPIAIYLDGFEFHKNIVSEDSAKRLALVQSAGFLQWSLTWADIDRLFGGVKDSSRNPFTECLYPEMQALQQRVSEKLGVSELAGVAVQSPFYQLMDYLKNPDRSAWMNLAFSRCLGWFEQRRMREAATRDAFLRQVERDACREMIDALRELGDSAFGGMSWANADDPLRIQCALPLAAINDLDPSQVWINLCLDSTFAIENAGFQSAWQGFLRAYNLLQFLPRVGFATREGVSKGLYDSIKWERANRADLPLQAEMPSEEVGLDEVLEEFREGVRALRHQGVPFPEVGFELIDPDGEVVAEAELGWPELKIAGLTEDQRDHAGVFERYEWATVFLDENGDWTTRLLAMIEENSYA